MSNRARLLLVLVVAGATWFLLSLMIPGTPGDSGPAASGAAASTIAEAVPAAPAIDGGKSLPAPDAGTEHASSSMNAPALTALALPPPDAPVSEIFDDLLDRARRGDARAACRLAADLQRCRRLADLPGMSSQLERRAVAASNEAARETMIDAIARIETARESHGDRCDGIESAQLAHAFALQVQAAQARPELRVWAAVNPALDMQFFVDDLDQWAQYRSLAMPWLQSAAADGDLAALIALARIHGDDRRPGPRNPPFRRLDDRESLLYSTLLERYGVDIPPVRRAAEEARARLDAAALAEVGARADALFRPERAQTVDRDVQATAMRRTFDHVPEAQDCE